ncbi:MAG: cation transporter [Deferribacteraceae bacterium]|jgi:cation diffusion facilitator family transporter|nr:cation transporter [Deferribacteraceae bacterium]
MARRHKFKAQERISLIELLLELPNIIAITTLALLSGSLILALDAFESLGNVMQAGISGALSKKLQSSDKFKYDYGMGKIEAFGGFLATAFLFVGLLVVLMVSIRRLIEPSVLGDSLFLAIFVKIINVSIDVWLYIKQLKLTKSINSSFIRSNLVLALKSLVFDTVSLTTISVAYFFRSESWIVYVEPIVCIFCIAFLAYGGVKIIKETTSDLLDKTLDEAEQMQILKCMSKIFLGIKGFGGIRSRRSGHRVYIDLMVTFDNDKTYAEIYKEMETFDIAVNEIIPDSVTAIVIGKSYNSEEKGFE